MQEYDNAIAKYKQVLEESPSEVHAMYELAFTYYSKKDHQNALALARRGAQYRTELLPRFYEVLGNSLDDLGKRAEAIDVFKAATKQAPGTAMLHFNLGLALTRSGKYRDAKKVIQQSVSLDPNHASSPYLLANIYNEMGYRVPAILALSRFLLIEPASPRSKEALLMLDRLIGAGVTTGTQSNQINITLALSPESNKDEGDFDAVDLAMSISIAAMQIETKEHENSKFQLLAATYGAMAEVLARTKGNGFAARYYAPFFAEMDKQGFIQAFVHSAFQAGQPAGSDEWAKENEGKLSDFQAWLSAYRWRAAK